MNAIRNVPGLELIDEEELEQDDQDQSPVAYLMVPDARALSELVGLWRRWQRRDVRRGETPWHHVFDLLRDLRTWGPTDRVQPAEAHILEEELFGKGENDAVRLELELVYRSAEDVAAAREREVAAAVEEQRGRVVSRARILDVAYHALLVDLPVEAVRGIIQRAPDGVAGLDSVMHIRPQSIASSIDMSESTDEPMQAVQAQLGDPILAVLDGVPVAAHPQLASYLVVDDQFGLEPETPVVERVHGTAMASLVVHGDRNRAESPLPRRVHVVPVLGARGSFPQDRLVVDVIYSAVLTLRDGPNPTAPGVVIVNISLGNPRRPFSGQMSPWARLLDRLSYRFGLLFVVSAGNHKSAFPVRDFATSQEYEDASPEVRRAATLRALGAIVADRRLLSPAETVNGLTIGACNEDAVDAAARQGARVNIDPYGDFPMANPSSALGPGFALSVKPDVLLPGAREHVRFVGGDACIEVQPAGPARAFGLKVAAPPQAGRENQHAHTNGTSAAAALASRAGHRIHDALERAYGTDFLALPHVQRAVLLKALIVHPARWPEGTAALIRTVIGPEGVRHHVRQKDNIRRFLGFGLVDADDAVACAADRATFWATGTVSPNRTVSVSVPIPIAMGGQALPHFLSATLAWFTPIAPARQSYRSVRLKLTEPEGLAALAVGPYSNQPDGNQSKRGTLFTRCWMGTRAPIVGPATTAEFTVQREPDQGMAIDEAIPFGLAVTLHMRGVEVIYDQVRQRLGVAPRAAP